MRPPIHDESHIYGFGPFVLDSAERTLLHAGRTVHLTPKVLDTLLILVERRGQLVRKDELMEALWPDSYVEERNLTQNIFLLRKALGRGEPGRQYIYTVPKSGYRFTGDVREISGGRGANGQNGAQETVAPPDGSAAASLLPPQAEGGRPDPPSVWGGRAATPGASARHGRLFRVYVYFSILLILGALAGALSGAVLYRIMMEDPTPRPVDIGPEAKPVPRGLNRQSGG